MSDRDKYMCATGDYVRQEARDEIIYRMPVGTQVGSVPHYIAVKKGAGRSFLNLVLSAYF